MWKGQKGDDADRTRAGFQCVRAWGGGCLGEGGENKREGFGFQVYSQPTENTWLLGEVSLGGLWLLKGEGSRGRGEEKLDLKNNVS